MALRRLSRIILAAMWLSVVSTAALADDVSKQPPSFMRGVGKVVAGVIFEFPRTVVEASSEAPVVGTIVGVFAGAARAFQTTAAGLVEMASAFDPWGTKRRERE